MSLYTYQAILRRHLRDVIIKQFALRYLVYWSRLENYHHHGPGQEGMPKIITRSKTDFLWKTNFVTEHEYKVLDS